MKMDEYYRAIQSLPSWLSRPLAELPIELAEQVHEIRLRVGCPVQMTISGVLCTSACVPALRKIVLTQLQMDEIFLTLCGGSVHTHQAEAAQGYVTLPNGCRAGLGGRFFLHPTQGAVLQQLHSVNLRIARWKWITLPEELRSLLEQRLTGVLLIGEPDSGKTTLLRSIARALAAQDKTVCVIDERREICPGATVPYEQKLMAVDEISGLPKAMAVQMALRTLSPQFILLDELGGTEEVRALEPPLLPLSMPPAGKKHSAAHSCRSSEPAGRCRLPCCFVAGIIRVRLPRCGYYDGFTAGGYILFGGVRLVRRGCRLHPHAGASGSTPANHCAPGGDRAGDHIPPG